MNSVMSEAEGMELYKLLSELWVKGGMKTHKWPWLSNSLVMMEEIPPENRACVFFYLLRLYSTNAEGL